MSSLIECDVVVIGTNATDSIIHAQHLKQNAVILDVSVPFNVADDVLLHRPDVLCCQGGYVSLPSGAKLSAAHWTTPNGDAFCCYAEAVLSAMTGQQTPFSQGDLSKKNVLDALRCATDLGFSLGTIKYRKYQDNPLQNVLDVRSNDTVFLTTAATKSSKL